MTDGKYKALAIIVVIIIIGFIGVYIFNSGFNLFGGTTDMLGRNVDVPNDINKPTPCQNPSLFLST
jgi:hypothetical protein